MGTKMQVVSIERLSRVFGDYHVVVQFTRSRWFREPEVTVQHYRKEVFWKKYPQGTHLGVLDTMGDFLDQYVQQFEWSQAHGIEGVL